MSNFVAARRKAENITSLEKQSPSFTVKKALGRRKPHNAQTRVIENETAVSKSSWITSLRLKMGFKKISKLLSHF